MTQGQMAKARKKKTGRRSRKAKSNKRSWMSRIWRLALLACGIFVGLLAPWVLYLNYQVTTEFEGRKWDLPSRVYARPLELYPGALITNSDLQFELESAGYHRSSSVTRPGQFRSSGDTVEIYRRSFPASASTV